MIRESLAPGSRFAGVYATPDFGVCFQARIDTAGEAVADTLIRTQEQKILSAPVWIKLERKGNQFHGYYATDGGGTAWAAMAWAPQTIPMAKTVYIGLAVTSHAKGTLCEAKFAGVSVSGREGGIPDAELLAHPRRTLAQAYEELEKLGNWRADAAIIRKHGDLIASSLFTIARARELCQEPADVVLADYRRVGAVLPDSSFAVDALARVAILDGAQGLDDALKRIATKPKEDQDRFYVALMKGCGQTPETPAREVAVRSFVDYVGRSSGFALLSDALADLKSDEPSMSVCRSLIRQSMAQPSGARTAIVALRCMVLKSQTESQDDLIRELAQWVVTEFKDAQLGACATAVLADIHYGQGHYVEAIEAFQPGLFSGNQAESKMVESIENILIAYRTNTLLQDTVDLRRIYEASSERADALRLNVVALHCLRKTAEAAGVSLECFERSAQGGLKHCQSGPENEVWFWKGVLAAEEGDLGRAAAAYERFVRRDDRSVLAARACYDIARAKMAMGEEAKDWVARAKALCPCDAVMELERRLSPQASSQDR